MSNTTVEKVQELDERESHLIEIALYSRIEDMQKLADELMGKFAIYEAMSPEAKTEYEVKFEKSKEHIENADGTFTIDCSPHPTAYPRIAEPFIQMAKETQKLYDKIQGSRIGMIIGGYD